MKKWYMSRTIWVDVLASLAVIVQAVTGNAWLDAELQAGVITAVNILLRFITKKGLKA